MKNFIVLLSLCLYACAENKPKEKWISLFNGKNLEGWDIKISGHPINDNFKNTFIVEDSCIKVNYAEYDTFTHEFGHLFYKIPYSHYRLKMEYRILGSLMPGAPDYAEANSGVMLHAQSAQSMELNQNFPVSIEMQFLSRVDSNERATGNLASPGTHVVLDGKLYTDHMMYNHKKTFGDEWVSVEAIVLGDSVVHHVVEGDTVLTYHKPQIGGWEQEDELGWIEDKTWVKKMKGTLLNKGYIALQAEGHPVWFRKIEILDLSKPTKN